MNRNTFNVIETIFWSYVRAQLQLECKRTVTSNNVISYIIYLILKKIRPAPLIVWTKLCPGEFTRTKHTLGTKLTRIFRMTSQLYAYYFLFLFIFRPYCFSYSLLVKNKCFCYKFEYCCFWSRIQKGCTESETKYKNYFVLLDSLHLFIKGSMQSV